MTYAVATDVVAQFGLNEMADLLRDEQDLLTPELLAEALADSFGDERTDEEKQHATAAVARLNAALIEAAKMMDGYFMSVVTMPLTAEQIAAAPVKSCCLELTRCYLKDDDDNMSEGAEKRCKRWFEWLRDVSAGRVKLVAEQVHSMGIRSGRLSSRYDWSNFGK